MFIYKRCGCGCEVRPPKNWGARTCACEHKPGRARCVRATQKKVATHTLHIMYMDFDSNIMLTLNSKNKNCSWEHGALSCEAEHCTPQHGTLDRVLPELSKASNTHLKERVQRHCHHQSKLHSDPQLKKSTQIIYVVYVLSCTL